MSAGDLGAAALRAGVFLALWGTGAAVYAAWKRDGRALASAKVAAVVVLGLVGLAALSMMFALATHDFSILYVAQNNARETPLFYSIIGLCSAWASSRAPGGATRSSAGVATGPGIPSRTRRSCRGLPRPPTCTR